MENSYKKLVAMIFSIICFSSLTGLFMIDSHIGEGIPVELIYENDKLYTTYYSGENDIGAIVLSGFSSDQTAMLNVISELRDLGCHVLTFDFFK